MFFLCSKSACVDPWAFYAGLFLATLWPPCFLTKNILCVSTFYSDSENYYVHGWLWRIENLNQNKCLTQRVEHGRNGSASAAWLLALQKQTNTVFLVPYRPIPFEEWLAVLLSHFYLLNDGRKESESARFKSRKKRGRMDLVSVYCWMISSEVKSILK